VTGWDKGKIQKLKCKRTHRPSEELEGAETMSKHKEAAKSFLTMAGTGKVQEAYDQYVAPTFAHHNQYFRAIANRC